MYILQFSTRGASRRLRWLSHGKISSVNFLQASRAWHPRTLARSQHRLPEDGGILKPESWHEHGCKLLNLLKPPRVLFDVRPELNFLECVDVSRLSEPESPSRNFLPESAMRKRYCAHISSNHAVHFHGNLLSNIQIL